VSVWRWYEVAYTNRNQGVCLVGYAVKKVTFSMGFNHDQWCYAGGGRVEWEQFVASCGYTGGCLFTMAVINDLVLAGLGIVSINQIIPVHTG